MIPRHEGNVVGYPLPSQAQDARRHQCTTASNIRDIGLGSWRWAHVAGLYSLVTVIATPPISAFLGGLEHIGLLSGSEDIFREGESCYTPTDIRLFIYYRDCATRRLHCKKKQRLYVNPGRCNYLYWDIRPLCVVSSLRNFLEGGTGQQATRPALSPPRNTREQATRLIQAVLTPGFPLHNRP